MRQMESAVHRAFCVVNVDAGNYNLRLLISDKAHNSLLASTVKRNSLAWAEVLQVGVNLATNSMQGGSDLPLDCTPLLDGQNTAAACMAGGSMFSGQRNLNLVRERLDR